MRSSNLFLVALFVGACVAFIAVPVCADTVFSDNFESQAANSTSSIAPMDRRTGEGELSAFPNSASVGVWGWGYGAVSYASPPQNPPTGDTQFAQVTDFGIPGPAPDVGGSKYLRINHDQNPEIPANAVLTVPQTTAGTLVELTGKFLVGANTRGVDYNNGSLVALNEAGAPTFQWFTGVFTGGDSQFAAWTGAGGGAVTLMSGSTPLVYTADTWQSWKVDYVIGAQNATFSIDGGTPASVPVSNTGGYASGWNGHVVAFQFSEDLGSPSYCIDNLVVTAGAVPEPGSMAILVSALIGLVAYAWRKRRWC
jgi:hypothetical protein